MVPVSALEAAARTSCCWVASTVHVLPVLLLLLELLLLLIVLGPAGGLHWTLHVHHLRLLHHVRCLLLRLRAADTRLHHHHYLLLLLLVALLWLMDAGRLPLPSWDSSSCCAKLRVMLLLLLLQLVVLRGHACRRHQQSLELLHHLRKLRLLLL
jgi:hypothetical protein